jgi:hypothetical protein
MAQITSVTSESLQAQVRRLLPSQQGFGEDLQASNVITPVIDLTSTAEGSVLPQNLQTAIDTSTDIEIIDAGSTVTIVTTTGFWRVYGTITHKAATVDIISQVILNNGTTDNIVYELRTDSDSGTDDPQYAIALDLVIFVRSGDSIKLTNTNANGTMSIAYRQIADVNGNLVNPTGFSFE